MILRQPKYSSSVDCYRFVDRANTGKNKSLAFLFGTQPVFRFHRHAALQQASGAGAALTLTATVWDGNAYGLRKFQERYVGNKFKLKSRPQEFNKSDGRSCGRIWNRKRAHSAKTLLLDAFGRDALLLEQLGYIAHEMFGATQEESRYAEIRNSLEEELPI